MIGFKSVSVLLLTGTLLLVIIYALTYFINIDSESKKFSEEKPTAKAEKLVFPRSLVTEQFRKTPPKPFGLTYRGQPPSEFTPTTEKDDILHPHADTLHHRYHPYPNNIRDIIGRTNQLKLINFPRSYKQSPSQHLQQPAKTDDPFFMYKPNDPGEVNLLAPAHFRFAPPLWSNFKARSSRIYSGRQLYSANTRREEKFNNHSKPVRLTLNVYPNQEHRNGYGLNHERETVSSKIRFPEVNPTIR